MKLKGIKYVGILFTLLFTSSCGVLFGDGEGLTIENITTNKSNGVTTCTITYTDEEQPPLVFTIDDGVAGKDGVSISNVTAKVNEDNSTTLTITFSDPSVEPIVLTIPSGQKGKDGKDGKDGRDIVGVNYRKDDTTNQTIISFKYSDGTNSAEISIPNGKDGLSITKIESVKQDDGTSLIICTMSDGSQLDFSIETGREIDNITSRSDDEKYYLDITYQDGVIQTIEFDKPSPNKWLTGITVPETSLGSEGDFYLNTNSGDIYQKIGSSWVKLFTMNIEQNISYTVNFHIDESNGEYWPVDAKVLNSIRVVSGNNISDLQSYSKPLKDGYTFTGWYTSKVEDPYAGKFDDLTSVNRDLDLYPHWIIDSSSQLI